jgi:hypothetical protein
MVRPVLEGVLFVACAAALHAQQLTPGMTPDWDMRPILQEIGAHGTRLLEVLEKIETKAWERQGASETYSVQLQSSKDQARAVVDEASALMRQPDKLSKSLEFYFRIQALEAMAGSLSDGIRKYQNAELAQSLESLVAENGANRNRWQRYIVDLAAEREREFAVMDHEAQRCRGILAKQPVAPPSSKGASRGKKK